jgi:hypothetical protein
MTAVGHEDAFPPPRLSARCRFSQGTFTGTRGNGRVKFAYDGGGIGKGATATLLVDEKQVAEGKIPQTIMARFSLDETFDIGEDTGTPVLDEYEDRMPFRFTGMLKRFVTVLEPSKLSADEQQRLHDELAKAMAAVH